MDAMNLDVIIVGRGGGSIEDLWAFNEEIVARAIFDCRTPIISAVGHETDWTIADFVSDRRAPTPSAAAELAVSDYRQTLERLDNLRRRMDRNLTGRIDFFREKLSHIKTRLNFLSPQNKLNENKRRLADIEDALERIMKQRLSDCRQRLALLSGTLDAYSPAKKLAQGYAYVEVEKKGALHSVSDINAGDDIDIYLIDGHARAVVSRLLKMSKENEKTLTLEERFAHLEQIVARMEDADVSLDEAFELYKKGLDEVKSANDMVQGMEKAMLVLNSDGQLEEF